LEFAFDSLYVRILRVADYLMFCSNGLAFCRALQVVTKLDASASAVAEHQDPVVDVADVSAAGHEETEQKTAAGPPTKKKRRVDRADTAVGHSHRLNMTRVGGKKVPASIYGKMTRYSMVLNRVCL